MSDFDTYTLNTAEAIDAAFAKTFVQAKREAARQLATPPARAQEE